MGKGIMGQIGKFLDSILYALRLYFDGEAKKNPPLFNIKITHIYSSAKFENRFMNFAQSVKAWHKTIFAAEKIIGQNVHIDADGYIWPGLIKDIETKEAELDIAHCADGLLNLHACHKAHEKVEVPRVHLHFVAGGMDYIGFDGNRAYLVDEKAAAIAAQRIKRIQLKSKLLAVFR